jgi:hypothetical protein
VLLFNGASSLWIQPRSSTASIRRTR